MAEEVGPSQPTGRDYGCGLVAVLAAVMLTGSAVGTIVALYSDGLSFSLIFGATFSLLFLVLDRDGRLATDQLVVPSLAPTPARRWVVRPGRDRRRPPRTPGRTVRRALHCHERAA